MPTPNNFRVKSGLTVGTTISGGNTTITGFVNATSVNTATYTVGTNLVANSIGVYHTGTVNAASHTVGSSFIANSTGAYHTGTVNAATLSVGTTVVANSSGITGTLLTASQPNITALGTITNGLNSNGTIAIYSGSNTNFSTGFNVYKRGNTADASGSLATNAELGYNGFYGYNGTAFGRGAYFLAQATEAWTASAQGTRVQFATTPNGSTTNTVRLTLEQNGDVTIGGNINGGAAVNASSLTVGTNFIANTTRVVIGTAVGLQANGGIGTAGQVLTSNATTVYWSTPTTGTVTSIATANGLSGGTITSTGTLGVTTGSTLTVNTTGIHVNSALSITDLTLSGNLTVSGTTTYVNSTTLNVGDNIITLNADVGGAVAPTENAGIEINRGSSANVQFLWDETNDRWSTNGQPLALSSLVAAGAASGITTLAAGNTSITGFVNASASVNSAILAVGTNFIANTTGAYHTGTVNAASLTVGTAFVANSTQTTYGTPVLLNNGQQLRFQTVNTTAYAYFTQQNDDNFVFYTSNTTYGQRAVFSVFANSVTSTFNIGIGAVFNGGIYANASYGTAGQLLTSNGTGVYWSSPGAANVNTAAQYTWTNTHVFSANVAFGNSIGIPSGNSTVSGGMIFFGGLADANWKMGRNTNGTTKWYYTNNTIDILAANSNLEGIVLGNSLVSGRSYLETGHAGTYIAGNVTIGNTSSSSTINSTAISIDQVLSTNNGNGTNFKVGDDAWIGDINTADTLTIRGQQSANNGYIVFGNADTTTKLGRAGTGALTYNGAFAAGNTTITGFANVSTTLQVGTNTATFGTAAWIVSNGNFGVGTASPGTKLHVGSDYIISGTATATSGTKILGGFYSGTEHLTTFGSEYSSGGAVLGYGIWPSTAAAGSFISSTAVALTRAAYTVTSDHTWYGGGAQTVAVGSAVTTSERMRLTNAGNLGIANAAPTDKLSVNGTTYLQGVTTLAANIAMANNNITRPVLTGYTEAEVSNTAATGTWTMDCGAANFFDLTLTGNITISPTNVPPSTRVWAGTIAAKQDATGGRTITWPTGIKWPGGSAPPATTTANAIDIWSLMTYDGGSTWVGSLTVKNVA